jgi:hypothetical protein
MYIFAVFSADPYHSIDSKRFHGLYQSKSRAIDALSTHLEGSLDPLLSHDERMLELTGQTQGREENWIIECHEVDTPITAIAD